MEKETIGRSAALLMEQDAVERDPTASPTLRLKILTSAVFNFISPDTRRRASIATVGARFARTVPVRMVSNSKSGFLQ
jgi:hypothetical protein